MAVSKERGARLARLPPSLWIPLKGIQPLAINKV